MKLLIVGGSGFLGRELARRSVAAGHDTTATFHSHPCGDITGAAWHRLDLRHRTEVESLVSRLRPQTVMNVGFAMADWAATAEGPAFLAIAAEAVGARMVQVSSDAVFSGESIWYDETCPPDPVTPYGAAKAAAEMAVGVISPQVAIVRTSLIIGNGDSAHETRIHAIATGKIHGGLFTDDVRCPVHVTDLASALLEIATARHAGVLHVAGTDPISRFRLGQLVARRDGLDPAALPATQRIGSGVPGPGRCPAADGGDPTAADHQAARRRGVPDSAGLTGFGCTDHCRIRSSPIADRPVWGP